MLNLMLLLDLIDISILEQGEFSKTIEQPIAKRDNLNTSALTAPRCLLLIQKPEPEPELEPRT